MTSMGHLLANKILIPLFSEYISFDNNNRFIVGVDLDDRTLRLHISRTINVDFNYDVIFDNIHISWNPNPIKDNGDTVEFHPTVKIIYNQNESGNCAIECYSINKGYNCSNYWDFIFPTNTTIMAFKCGVAIFSVNVSNCVIEPIRRNDVNVELRGIAGEYTLGEFYYDAKNC